MNTRPAFRPTHALFFQFTDSSGSLVRGHEFVQLEANGSAYTENEWTDREAPSYERLPSGEWTVQGQPFGEIRLLPLPPFEALPKT